MPACGSGCASVPSPRRGTRLAGGAVPFTHSSSARNKARWIGAEFSGFWNCWQLPLLVALPVPC